jgi:hypothetical protein
MPRFRYRLRTMMILVAVAAVGCGTGMELKRRRERFLRLAACHDSQGPGKAHAITSSRMFSAVRCLPGVETLVVTHNSLFTKIQSHTQSHADARSHFRTLPSHWARTTPSPHGCASVSATLYSKATSLINSTPRIIT